MSNSVDNRFWFWIFLALTFFILACFITEIGAHNVFWSIYDGVVLIFDGFMTMVYYDRSKSLMKR